MIKKYRLPRPKLAKNLRSRQSRWARLKKAQRARNRTATILFLLTTFPICLLLAIILGALSKAALYAFQLFQTILDRPREWFDTPLDYLSRIRSFIVLCYRRYQVNKAHPDMANSVRILCMLSTSQQLSLKHSAILDTGCTNHVFWDKEKFTDIRYFTDEDATHTIIGIGGSELKAIGIGRVKLAVTVNGKAGTLYLKDVLYCPELGANLVGVRQLLDRNATITLSKCKKVIYNGETQLCELDSVAGLLLISQWTDKIALQAYSHSTDPVKALWHDRLGHPNERTLRNLEQMSTTFNQSKIEMTQCICETCARCTMRDASHRETLAKGAKNPYEVIFSDVEGPINIPNSHLGARYFVTFLCAFSKESEVYLIKYKSQVAACLAHYKATKESPYTGRRIRRVHSDGGGEYLGQEFQKELKEDHIQFTYSIRASQQQNGAAERLNQTLINKAFKILDTSGLPQSYWPLAVEHANQLRNIMPVEGRHITPYEIVNGVEPVYDPVRIFGCRVWYRPGSQEKFKKFRDKGKEGSYIGYHSRHIIKILTPEGKITRATAVAFEEKVKPGTSPIKRSIDDISLDPSFPEERVFHTGSFYPWTSSQDNHVHFETPSSPAEKQANHDSATQRRSARLKEREEMVTRAHFAHYQIHKQDPRSQTFVHLAYNSIAHTFATLASAAETEPLEPQNWKKAMSHQHAETWKKAAQEEYDSLIENKTWTLQDLPSDRVALKGRWVFKYKRGPNGRIIRYKARWVVRGYEQKLGIDYADTFASVVKPMSYKSLFAIAAALDLEIEQMDVKTAFLYGSLDEVIYVEQPHGFEDDTPRVCKLNKALYGLKQSPRVWYRTLSMFLISNGYNPIDADHSVFSNKDGTTFIAAYVDDLLIVGPDMTIINELKANLSNKFQMSDLGPVHHYLGMTITRDRPRHILKLGQKAYLEEAIRTAGLWDSNPPLTPMVGPLEPTPDDHTSTAEFKALYQSYVGTLMYAMLGTRPDIAYAVSSVSRHASNPTEAHMKAVKRIFSYLRGTIDLQLTYRGELAQLEGYSDADFGGDLSTMRSTSGFVFNIGSGAISWSSKRQPTVALSTTEAEYRAQTGATKEAVWLRQLLHSLAPQEQTPHATIIYCDNQSAIALAKDPKFHARTKYIAIEEHWVREKIKDGTIELDYVSTTKQMADGLTKALPKDAFLEFRDLLGLE